MRRERTIAAVVALVAAVVCSAVVLGLQWAQWRDAASATTRFRRGSAQVAATVGRGLAAPTYMGRVDGLLDGRADVDSAGLARAAGSLPSNGLIEALGAGYVGDLTNVCVLDQWLPGFADVCAASPESSLFGSNYKDVYAFIVLILVLVFRPSGLLGERVGDRA